MKIHHVGYIVKRIERAIYTFEGLGFNAESEIVFDDYRGIDICFMIKDGYRIELVSPKNKDSVVYDLQKKYGNSPYHICYTCSDLEQKITELRNCGFVQLDDAHEAIALCRMKVCFLVHPYMGMIELLEEK